jgi:predicted aldo/keto reductase-like oxidoreductase
MERTLGEEWARTWDENLPDCYDTPGEINVRWILRLRNLAVAYDMVEYAKMRYNLLGNGGHWFPGNKADKLDELDLSECLANSPHAEEIPDALAEAHALLAGEEKKRLQET